MTKQQQIDFYIFAQKIKRKQEKEGGKEKGSKVRRLEFSDGLVSRQPLWLPALPSNCSYAALFEVLNFFPKSKDEG